MTQTMTLNTYIDKIADCCSNQTVAQSVREMYLAVPMTRQIVLDGLEQQIPADQMLEQLTLDIFEIAKLN